MTTEDYKFIVCGNEAAERFCKVFVAHCHLLDDLVDGDKPWDDERIIASEINWLMELCGNPFFLAHKPQLISLIATGFNAWLDANRWAKDNDSRKALASDVVKGIYHEVVHYCALACGGWKHLREVTTRFREYDFDQKGDS